MTPPLRSGSIAFSPRARLLKLIGAELISDDVVAVTELVKKTRELHQCLDALIQSNRGAPGGTDRLAAEPWNGSMAVCPERRSIAA